MGGGWVGQKKTKLMLYSTLVEIEVEVGVELGKNVTHGHQVRSSEKYKVNFARTSRYMQSTIPYCQRLLNKHINEQ